MIGITVAILLALLATGARAGEQTKPFEGFTKYVKYHVRYEVNPDGTHVETHDWALKVLSDQGVSAANSASVSFSDRLQEAEILSAYTLKKDGRRIDVPASNFQEESNTGNGEASPMFFVSVARRSKSTRSIFPTAYRYRRCRRTSTCRGRTLPIGRGTRWRAIP